MVHRICNSARNGEFEYVQDLWSDLFAPDVDMSQKLETLFVQETAELDLEYGFFSRIDTDERVQHLQVVHGPDEILRTGQTIPLSKTYCRKTIADPNGTMTVGDAPAEGWRGDPAYEKFELASYVGTTVIADDELYGTLCFASTAPRPESLREPEVALVEMFGQWATFELNQWTGPPTHGSLTSTVTSIVDDGLAPARMDSMMDAFGKRERRRILLALLDEPVLDRDEFLDRYLDVDEVPTKFHHRHLPKLNESGYVDWNAKTGELSRGPSFDDVEPLLRLLRGYMGDAPD